MAVTVKRFDLLNNRVYMNVDVGVKTTITVQELGSAIKDHLQKAPFIDDDKLFIWSGNEEYLTGTKSGVIMTMQGGWTIWTEDQGSKHRFEINRGLLIDSVGGDPLGTPTNVVWSLAEQAVSAITAGGGGGVNFFRSLDR